MRFVELKLTEPECEALSGIIERETVGGKGWSDAVKLSERLSLAVAIYHGECAAERMAAELEAAEADYSDYLEAEAFAREKMGGGHNVRA